MNTRTERIANDEALAASDLRYISTDKSVGVLGHQLQVDVGGQLHVACLDLEHLVSTLWLWGSREQYRCA